jgi:hypothetical protein
MNYKVITIASFRNEAKRLIKKYPSLEKELADLGQQLSSKPTLGTSIGNGCYKICLTITSKGRGKSGGARVITYVFITGNIVFLLSIYDKSEKDNISDSQLRNLLKFIP